MNDNADEYSFLGEESVNANKIEKNKWLQEPVSIDAIENLKNHLSHDNYILFKQMYSNVR